MSEENALISIQHELKAPKGQFNKFGNYKYRSCEDILEAVKPILDKYSAILTISDDIVTVGGWVFVKATAILKVGSEIYAVSAFARLENEKKGMDAAQLTGCASSYARKYALNGLFLIDDTKDSDAIPPTPQAPQGAENRKPDIRQGEGDKGASAVQEDNKKKIAWFEVEGISRGMLVDAFGIAPESFGLNDWEIVKAAYRAMKQTPGKDFPTAYAEVMR